MTKKKYKPVALKTHPVLSTLPSKFRIERNIVRDPLADIPTIPLILPPFAPRSRYTKEQRNKSDSLHPPGFLWPAERDLLHHFISLQNEGFTWDDSEHGEEGMTLEWGETPKVVASSKESIWDTRLSMDMAT